MHQQAMFAIHTDEPTSSHVAENTERYSQYLTPAWASAALVERFFPDLNSNDFVIEPSCGEGSFLAALPDNVPCLGIEIDPVLADIARARTGKPVLTGDFRTIQAFDTQPTALVGNPPFVMDTIDAFLDRAHSLLTANGRLGFILPAYAFQTAGRVCRYSSHWSIEQHLIPRNIYQGLSLPLVFAVFAKDRQRALVGFALYHETAQVKSLPERFRAILEGQDGPVWLKAVTRALHELGGQASIDQIFRTIGANLPTENSFPRQQIRKVLQQSFERVERAVYRFPIAA